MQNTRVLGLIPARGGSKGIPRKNIKMLGGKPLIAWTIEAARRSSMLAEVVVSTDDDEIASVGREYGAAVPFMRPAELARDDTPGSAPAMHALEQLPAFDAVLLLQPTSPLRTTEDIDACLAMGQRRDSVVSVSESETHPYWMYRIGEDNSLHRLIEAPPVSRRQDLPKVYALNGALYYADRRWLSRERRFIGTGTLPYVMPPERSIDLDTLLAWKVAELLLRETS